MPCNCGKKKIDYIYTDGSGQQHTYPTLIGAKAHRIRDEKAGKPVGSVRESVKT